MYANGLARRIARLVAAHPPPCEECGLGPNEPITDFAVEWADAAELDDEPEHCEACGRPTRLVVTWDFVDRGDA